VYENLVRFSGCPSSIRISSACLGGEEQAIAEWQIKRDGTYRGIIEIVEEQI
jgi:hypothetical protein